MADFKKAIGYVLQWEGGYVNDPDDAGGETYRGISRKNWPTWEGWALVDLYKAKRAAAGLSLPDGAIILDSTLSDMVETFYYKTVWLGQIQGDKIADQRAAGFLFDWQVHSGDNATKGIQRMVSAVPDGALGPKTLELINNYPADQLFTHLKERRIAFYYACVQARPKNQKYLKGWLRRVNEYA